jgi:hypothetical protein
LEKEQLKKRAMSMKEKSMLDEKAKNKQMQELRPCGWKPKKI